MPHMCYKYYCNRRNVISIINLQSELFTCPRSRVETVSNNTSRTPTNMSSFCSINRGYKDVTATSIVQYEIRQVEFEGGLVYLLNWACYVKLALCSRTKYSYFVV